MKTNIFLGTYKYFDGIVFDFLAKVPLQVYFPKIMFIVGDKFLHSFKNLPHRVPY